jgi:hypothetical protein
MKFVCRWQLAEFVIFFAGYVVTCFAICVVIFGISLAAVSSAEMTLVCVISKLWWVFFVAFVSTREMHF